MRRPASSQGEKLLLQELRLFVVKSTTEPWDFFGAHRGLLVDDHSKVLDIFRRAPQERLDLKVLPEGPAGWPLECGWSQGGPLRFTRVKYLRTVPRRIRDHNGRKQSIEAIRWILTLDIETPVVLYWGRG